MDRANFDSEVRDLILQEKHNVSRRGRFATPLSLPLNALSGDR